MEGGREGGEYCHTLLQQTLVQQILWYNKIHEEVHSSAIAMNKTLSTWYSKFLLVFPGNQLCHKTEGSTVLALQTTPTYTDHFPVSQFPNYNLMLVWGVKHARETPVDLLAGTHCSEAILCQPNGHACSPSSSTTYNYSVTWSYVGVIQLELVSTLEMEATLASNTRSKVTQDMHTCISITTCNMRKKLHNYMHECVTNIILLQYRVRVQLSGHVQQPRHSVLVRTGDRQRGFQEKHACV